jgi:hypothetical protein
MGMHGIFTCIYYLILRSDVRWDQACGNFVFREMTKGAVESRLDSCGDLPKLGEFNIVI